MNVKEKINEIIKKQMSNEVAVNADMLLESDLGMDSLRRTQIICDIEENLGIEFQIEDLCSTDLKNVQDLYDMTEKYIR